MRTLVTVAVVGRAPGFFRINVFGDQLGSDEFATAGVLAVALLVAPGLGYLYRGRLLARLQSG